MIEKLKTLLKNKYTKYVLGLIILIWLVWFIYPRVIKHIESKYQHRIEILVQDSIRSYIYRDSIHIEYKVLQDKIDRTNHLDSLRAKEYGKLLNHNSLLSRDSLRHLFTGS